MVRRFGTLSRRAFLGGLATAGAAARPAAAASAGAGLAADVGALLMLGFNGSSTASQEARDLAAHLAAGRAAGVVFRKLNIGTGRQVAELIELFSAGGGRPLLAIDHEGRYVQRLVGPGYTRLPTAREVAARYDTDEARRLYATAAAELAETGFNLNLAPVVDLDNPKNPAVGRFGRSFGHDPVVIAAYARVFVEAFAAAGVACALKHFPGEGLADADSHFEVADISRLWRAEADLEPYRRLIESGTARLVMTGHARLTPVDPAGLPASLSRPVVTGLLRERLGFRGIAMTDDLDMEPLAKAFGRREALLRALAAGNDLPMVCNTEDYDSELPQRAVAWVEEAIAAGRLTAAAIAGSAERVRALRRSLG